MNYEWMPAVLFLAYLLYGFLRPWLSREWRREIEEEIGEEPSEEAAEQRAVTSECRRCTLANTGSRKSERLRYLRDSIAPEFRDRAHRPIRQSSSSAFTFLPDCARSRIASVNSYSPRGDGFNFAVNSKMLGRNA